jgi:predicted metalloprotease with PDZ domain
MTHEMVHLAFPSVARKHHWIEEGLATYIEPIARARAGELTAEKVWGDMVRGMPQGLPQPGDRGLDVTHTWANTYWGGARFCLLADIEIRNRTKNKQGLEDALRAILKQGGTIEANWNLSHALEIGDRATGVPVLRDLYDKMSATPQPTDLNKLWKDLGIDNSGGRIVFDDTAPLASIRKAITQTVPASQLPKILPEP